MSKVKKEVSTAKKNKTAESPWIKTFENYSAAWLFRQQD